MKKSAGVSCSMAVSLFRGLYARVAHDLGVDASYISRIARGERKSKVAEKALHREFNKVLAYIRNNSARTDRNRRGRTRTMVRKKQQKTLSPGQFGYIKVNQEAKNSDPEKSSNSK
jgi:hypothetical protein